MKQTPKEKKNAKNEIKEGVIRLFNEVGHHMKPRTRNDYADEIKNTDKLMSIKRIGRELEKFKEVNESNKGILLTKQKTNQITKDTKIYRDEIKLKLKNELREFRIKRDEKTWEQKLKIAEKETKKYNRKALGGVYKNTFVYAEDINGVFGFEMREMDPKNISNVLTKMLTKDLII